MPGNTFKQDIITTVSAAYDKFYIHAMPHPDLAIGKRGLLGEEAERGIVLVFGDFSYRDMDVDAETLTVTMRFGGSWEYIVIPMACISTVFNDPSTPDFIFNFLIEQTESEQPKDDVRHAADVETEKEDNIIKVRFKKDEDTKK